MSANHASGSISQPVPSSLSLVPSVHTTSEPSGVHVPLTSLVPGLSSAQVQQVSDALRNGQRGPIVDIQDADGDGVVISTE